MVQKHLYFFLNNLWEKSKDFSHLFLYEKFIFIFLFFCELMYRAGFFVVCAMKKLRGGKRAEFFVISVGNISVGGTGKSVFTKFLIESINKYHGAIVLRGHGRHKVKNNSSKSFFASKGNGLLCDAQVAGDEASMFATTLLVPVVVGRDRYQSCEILSALQNKPDYVVLDDAYQNFQLQKDLEIVLLDSRKPFENGHCLPAGKLREKDLSRSDIIVFTHADDITEKQLCEIKKDVLTKISHTKIVAGKHVYAGLFDSHEKKIAPDFFTNKKVGVFAGIGSYEQFVESVQKLGVCVSKKIQYPDHHNYTFQDMKTLQKSVSRSECDALVTTRKDWQKIKPLLQNIDTPIFIFDICFEFLSRNDELFFFDVVREMAGWSRL